MRKLLMIATAFAFFGAANANADPVAGVDRVAHCGKLWKDHKAEHGKPEKGTGREAWSKFRTECIAKLKEEAKPVKAEQKS